MRLIDSCLKSRFSRLCRGDSEPVGDQTHLDYLYVLTVAAVRGTNPKLWNSWKASLFKDLYELTSRALRRGLENPIDREQLIAETQEQARALLNERAIADKRIDAVWTLFNEDYFLRHKSEEIVWHTEWLADSDTESPFGLVDVRRQQQGDGVEAVLYTPRIHRTFAHTTAVLDEMGMNIVDARISPLDNGYSLDTYVFMELDKRIEIDDSRLDKIRRTLTRVLTLDDDNVTDVTRRAPRQVRMFPTKTSVNFGRAMTRGKTVLELVTGDRPGLLSKVGKAFVAEGIDIETAKIVTIGERAEDVFYISKESGEPLGDDDKEQLRNTIIQSLSN